MARRVFSPTGRIDDMLVAGGFGAADRVEYVRLFHMAADCPQ